jgi:short-subunit dehydrogenase
MGRAGQTVRITGASSGLGALIAKGYAEMMKVEG